MKDLRSVEKKPGERRMRPQDGANTPHNTDNNTSPSHPLEPATPQSDDTLADAVERWRSRGYAVQYDDGLLVQLSRRESPLWWMLILLALALGAFGLGAVLLWLAWRGWRRWSVVSLTQTPDQRVITHRQLTTRPPIVEEPTEDSM